MLPLITRRKGLHKKLSDDSGGGTSSLARKAMTILGVGLLVSRIRYCLTPPSAFEFAERPLPENPVEIPHIIHQSYKSLEQLPPAWIETPSRWKELHPSFEYKFWSDEDNRNMIVEDYPWFLETFDSYQHPIQRADAARYFAVLKYGGIYADLDILPLRQIDSLLQRLSGEEELLVAETHNLGLTNALFAGVPNSSVLNEFVHTLPKYTHPFYGLEFLLPHFGVMLSTGPTRFWIFLSGHREKIVTLHPSGWGQCHLCRQGQPGQCTVQPNSYFETTTGGSWHKWDTQFMNFIFCFPQFFAWFVCGAMVAVYRYVEMKITTNAAAGGADTTKETLPLVRTTSKGRRGGGGQVLFLSLRAWMMEAAPNVQLLAHQVAKRQEVVAYFAILWILSVLK